MAEGMNDMIKRYREGSLTSAERHALEKKALSDPFLADALEGAETVSAGEFSADVASLSEKLRSEKKQSWFTPVRIAASILLLLGVGSIFYYILPAERSAQEMQTAGPLAKLADSTGRDSANNMLSLVKPDETAQEEKRSTNQPPAVLRKNEQEKAGEAKPAVELSREADKTLLAQREKEKLIADQKARVEEIAAEEKVAEQNAKIAPPELADKKTEDLVLTDLSTASGASAKEDSKLPKSISKRSSADISEKVVEGKVISAVDGSPLPGVTVVQKGTDKGTVTDVKGNFSIAMTQPNTALVFSFIGFQPVEVTTEKNVVDVAMNEEVSQLSEVVVIGRAISRDDSEPVVRMAVPVGGIKAYDKYLEANLRYPKQALESKVKGKVTISFTVTTLGDLTEFNVVKGLGHGCEDEVIRLVKEGPKWTPSSLDNVAVESEVRVKMKFDPEKANK
jgi:TonB family protein